MSTRILSGNGGLEKVVLESPHGIVEIYRLGACLTRYAVGPREIIFLSKTSVFTKGKAIRGGVPICWPWFGPHPADPKLGQHGFARSTEWTVLETDEGRAVLELVSTPDTHKLFPHDFRLTFTVAVTPEGLTFELTTHNTGKTPFTYGEALHTYFNIGDIKQTQVTGFNGLTYIDKVDGGKRKVEHAQAAGVTGETDRVYLDAAGPHDIDSPAGSLRVHKVGSKDTVFWNPWDKKAEGLPDLAGNQWPTFVCVEAVNTGDHAITLAPGASHTIACRLEPR